MRFIDGDYSNKNEIFFELSELEAGKYYLLIEYLWENQ